MADKLVRTHTNQSNRAKAKDALERKVVFRSVLDNPFRVQWPSIPINIQNAILARFIDMVQGVSEYHVEREIRSRKRKSSRAATTTRATKRPRWAHKPRVVDGIVAGSAPLEQSQTADSVTADGEHDVVKPRPDVLNHLTFGINEVTKLLEKTSRSYSRTTVSASSTQEPPSDDRPRIILVCRGDVSPPALLQHIPHVVAACNTRGMGKGTDGIHLVTLSKGAEASLAEAVGLRRISVVAVHVDAPSISELTSLLENIPPPTASWLAAPMDTTVSLIPTHIKQLRTTAPKDMKAAKEQRSRGRAAAKLRKKERIKGSQKAGVPAAEA
ncbi:uncharacterized protein C8Q71DRAFT_756488 [Rhodofomes roseus]|uniref:Uncharacterized protein n=1 Tax=Rhodofomes roseus TaxID=34475 RepID=A0ABQ8KHZ7_9APHY|nr:uncharacterized protein C8Q71DRAFT_756488 [Rhodofomes roseus]KAH9837012.1 hypothetical protein C8Q71DRAFT_756488 [Rhodofomes roseus]